MNNNTFKPAMIFGDHMVLQRNKPIPVWGNGENGTTVCVTLDGQMAHALVENGEWKVVLPPSEAATGKIMKLQCEDEILEFHDVSIGEVWLAGGQSNMEFFLRYDAEHDQTLLTGENSHIRFFDYPEVSYEEQLEKFDYSHYGMWRECNRANMDYYSAVGYYFADKLQKYCQVPVGIVGCNWGGTTASCWMGEEYLKGHAGQVWLDEYEEGLKNLDLDTYDAEFDKSSLLAPKGDPFTDPSDGAILRGLPDEELLAFFDKFELLKAQLPSVIGPKSMWRPGGLYHTMLKNVAPYGIRGIIWYQGESDDVHADVYDTVLTHMIRCWRDLWREKLPFLLTQIAPCERWPMGAPENYPLIREQQEKVSRQVPGVWMTSIGDEGLRLDVHPKRKKPVGKRLALLAIGHVYGEDILCDPPECIDMTISTGKLVLSFRNAEGGLVLKGDQVAELECCRNGVLMDNNTILVENDTIVIHNNLIQKTDKLDIHFAQKPYHKVNVFNQADIPVRPFRIRN